MPSMSDSPTIVVKSLELLRDVRSSLLPHVPVAQGRLDEAIARGLGYKTRAALVAAFNNGAPLHVIVQEQGFQERLRDLGFSAPDGLFLKRVLDSASGPFGDVLVGFEGDQKKILGRVKVRMSRVPSEAELDDYSLEYDTFLPAFLRWATLADPMEAIAIDMGDAVDLDGYWIPIGPGNTWLRVIDPAPQ